jgi:hypothetical protein
MQVTSIKPPSVHVQERVGAQLSSLGATLVDTPTFSEVEVRFTDPKMTEVANGAFEGAIDGVKLRFTDGNGNGVRGIAGGYAVVDAVAQMAGVTKAMALESHPLQLSFTTTPDAKSAVDMLLRASTAHGETIHVD